MERRLDELHRHLQQHGHAQAARADARDRQPDDPDDGANEGDDDGEEREGEAEQPPDRPAVATAAAHPVVFLLQFTAAATSIPFAPFALARGNRSGIPGDI